LLTRVTFQKVFIDQLFPSGGMAGTFMAVRTIHRQGAPRETSAAVVIANFISYYGAYAVCLVVTLAVLWYRQKFNAVAVTLFCATVVIAVGLPLLVFGLHRLRAWTPPPWLQRRSGIRSFLETLREVPVSLIHRPLLLAEIIFFQIVVFA